MRAYNERLVLSLLRRHGALAKAGIAQMTGLSAQTVSVIMRGLENDGLIRRGQPQRVRGKVGQPSVPMSLNAEGAYFYGLKLGRRSSDLILIDFLGNIIESIHETYPYPTPDNALEFTRNAVARIEPRLSDNQRERIAGLGIGIPFQMWNWAETIGAPQSVMDAWRGADIRAEMQNTFDFPVYLQNDATAACGAELAFGRRGGPRDFLYFYIGYFIGGGIALGNSLYPGRSANAGAVGPMPVPDENGKLVQLIDIASISVLEQQSREAGADWSSLWKSSQEWQIDPSILEHWIESSARAIAQASYAAVSIIDFEAIIIDGWLPLPVRHRLVKNVAGYFEKLDFAGLEQPRVIEGSVGHQARALGAASLPLSLRFMVDPNAFLKN